MLSPHLEMGMVGDEELRNTPCFSRTADYVGVVSLAANPDRLIRPRYVQYLPLRAQRFPILGNTKKPRPWASMREIATDNRSATDPQVRVEGMSCGIGPAGLVAWGSVNAPASVNARCLTLGRHKYAKVQ